MGATRSRSDLFGYGVIVLMLVILAVALYGLWMMSAPVAGL